MNPFVEEDAKTIANAGIDWGKLENKIILVAGANGYVPQFFVHGLLMRNTLFHAGIRVIALCRSAERAALRFSEYKDRDDFELLMGDVTRPLIYEGEIDYIIHAASPADLKTRYEDLAAVFNANVIGCKNLLELAREKNATLLFLSSVDVYGKNEENIRLSENFSGSLDWLNPRNIYSSAKKAAETLCSCYANQGCSCKIVRPCQILGSGISLDDGRLHVDFISQMLSGNAIVLKGDGTPIRTFLYITDAIIGMLTVMLEGNSGEAYNIAAEEGEASVLELAQTMASLADDRKIDIVYNMETRNSDPAVTNVISFVCADPAKIRALGWKPAVPLREACKRMMMYYGL